MEKFLESNIKEKEKYPWMKDVPLLLLVGIFFGYFNTITSKSYLIIKALLYLFILLVISKIIYPPLFNGITSVLSSMTKPKITLDNIINKVNQK